jgi:hypothetical protein
MIIEVIPASLLIRISTLTNRKRNNFENKSFKIFLTVHMRTFAHMATSFSHMKSEIVFRNESATLNLEYL